MRTSRLLIFLSFTSAILAASLPEIPTVEHGAGAIYERDLLPLLGGDNISEHYTPPSSASQYFPSTRGAFPGLKGFGGMFTTQPTESATPESAAEGSQTSTATPNRSSTESTGNAVNTADTSEPTTLPVISAASQVSEHTSKTWQIIGIAIIAVLCVAVSVTTAMFFDRLWKLAQEVICCKARSVGSEDFVPDWEKQSWETRTLSPSPSDTMTAEGKEVIFTCTDAYVQTTQPRELPWNTHGPQWSALRRQTSLRSGRSVIA